jgi:calcineurin-like phosphoesterase family protein
MSTVRLISDPHFGDTNMAHHRGFQDEYYQDEYIIEQWNRIVKNKRDLTFILGDITMEKSFWYYQLDRLNGRKIVVGGNHDNYKHTAELLKYVESVAGIIQYKGFLLTHCPIHTHELYDRFRGNIHGHVHENTLQDPRYYNVSAEAIGYRPKTIDELINMYSYEGKAVE